MARRMMGALAVSTCLAFGCGGGSTNAGTTGGGGGTTTGGGTTGGASTGGSSTGGSGGATATVTIKNFSYSPVNLTVASPATLTFVNNDGMAHTATSEKAAKSYTPGTAPGGFSFDTSNIAGGGGTATVKVPAGLASGTVLPYFCHVHLGGMQTPDPTITIQ